MYARLRLVVLMLITLFIPATSSAQQANAPVVPTGPTIDAVVTGFRAPSASADSASSPLLQTRRERQSIALMIVGGAAIVVGAIIEDDVGTIFMVGGAVALLIGLYKYLS